VVLPVADSVRPGPHQPAPGVVAHGIRFCRAAADGVGWSGGLGAGLLISDETKTDKSHSSSSDWPNHNSS
jgi:hypothetical protein